MNQRHTAETDLHSHHCTTPPARVPSLQDTNWMADALPRTDIIFLPDSAPTDRAECSGLYWSLPAIDLSYGLVVRKRVYRRASWRAPADFKPSCAHAFRPHRRRGPARYPRILSQQRRQCQTTHASVGLRPTMDLSWSHGPGTPCPWRPLEGIQSLMDSQSTSLYGSLHTRSSAQLIVQSSYPSTVPRMWGLSLFRVAPLPD